MTPLQLSLVIQGVGGLFLVAVCAAVYASRRQPYFLYWTLAWLSFSGWLLLGALALRLPELAPALGWLAPGLRAAAVACSAWHPLLWAYGVLHFRRGRGPWPGLGVWFALTTVLALVSLGLPLAPRFALRGGALAVVYAWSAAVFAAAPRRGRFGARFLGFWLGLYALEQVQYLFALWLYAQTGVMPGYTPYLSFADFFVQTFVGVGMILVLLDEEERRRREALADQADRLLQEERDFSAQVVETADAFIVVLEPSGQMVRCNGKCRATFGWSEGGRTRALWELPTPPAGEAALRAAFAQARADGGAAVEAALRDRAGAERVVAWHLSVVRGVKGEVRWVIGAGLDITDQRRLEAQLRQRAEALARADRHKDEFLAMLAHELRDPLMPVLANLEVLGAAPADADRVAAMGRQLRHLTRLVDDLLDVSRLIHGKVELRRQAVDLGDVLRQAAEMARPTLEARRHALTLSAAGGLRVDGDPVRLVQVFANLLNNAAKYTGPGGRVEVRAGREGGEVVARVRDNGVGIAPEALPHIFGLFAQADASGGRPPGGLGIGLTVVRRLVGLHGGAVTAASAGPGTGSEFVVRLPALQEGGGRVKEGEPSGPGGSMASSSLLAPVKVLVVDDNVDAVEGMGAYLRAHGHEVRTAQAGPEALAAAAAFHPDAAVLDIGLPGMDGYEVARLLREQRGAGEGLLLLALTGREGDEDRQRAQQAGFDHYLLKPIEPEVLLRLIGAPAAKA